jgi:hypothetical protein
VTVDAVRTPDSASADGRSTVRRWRSCPLAPSACIMKYV